MKSLETLAQRAVENPPASLTPMSEIERRVSRRRVRAQAKLVGATVLFIGASLAAITTLGQSDADNIVAVSPTTTSIPKQAPPDLNQWSATPELIFGKDTSLDSVFGRPLSTTIGVWPDGGLPYDELMKSFATDVLNWPAATWDPIMEQGGLATAFLRSDGSVNATELLLSLDVGPNGWIVSSSLLSSGADMQLENESLIAFADTRFGADTASVDAYRWDGTAQWATVFNESANWVPTMTLPRPIPATGLGPYLAIGRDANGAAIDMISFNAGFPERLTLDLDSVFEGLPPVELPDPFGEYESRFGPLDYSNVRLLTGPSGKLYIIPTSDRSALVMSAVVEQNNEEFMVSTEASAAVFNQTGAWVGGSGSGYSYVWYLVPDGVTIGDVEGTQVDATGRLVWVSGTDSNQLAVVDGVLTKTD